MTFEELLEQYIEKEKERTIKNYEDKVSHLEKEYADQISVLADKLLGLQKEIAKLKRARGLNY